MDGIIRYIRHRKLSSLIDENGTERLFKRSELQNTETMHIREHDAVSFSLDGSRVYDIELLKRHRGNRIVFSFI